MRYKKANDFFESLPNWVQWAFRITFLGLILLGIYFKK